MVEFLGLADLADFDMGAILDLDLQVAGTLFLEVEPDLDLVEADPCSAMYALTILSASSPT